MESVHVSMSWAYEGERRRQVVFSSLTQDDVGAFLSSDALPSFAHFLRICRGRKGPLVGYFSGRCSGVPSPVSPVLAVLSLVRFLTLDAKEASTTDRPPSFLQKLVQHDRHWHAADLQRLHHPSSVHCSDSHELLSLGSRTGLFCFLSLRLARSCQLIVQTSPAQIPTEPRNLIPCISQLCSATQW